QLERELLGHRFPTSLASETDQPAAGEGEPALGPDLDRDLVGGTAHPPRLDLELGGGVADREVEDLQRLLAGLLAGPREGVVGDPLGDRALAGLHEDVDELGDRLRAVDRVGRDTTLVRAVAAGHLSTLACGAGLL